MGLCWCDLFAFFGDCGFRARCGGCWACAEFFYGLLEGVDAADQGLKVGSFCGIAGEARGAFPGKDRQNENAEYEQEDDQERERNPEGVVQAG